MEIIFSEECMPAQRISEYMQEAGELCIRKEGLDPDKITVSVTFVSPEEIQELNRIYQDKDRVTDVLSFPQYDDLAETEELDLICIGDVVICTEQALLQAHDFGHSPERELVYLFVHSLCHLLGFDHEIEDEKDFMRIREEEIMLAIGLER